MRPDLSSAPEHVRHAQSSARFDAFGLPGWNSDWFERHVDFDVRSKSYNSLRILVCLRGRGVRRTGQRNSDPTLTLLRPPLFSSFRHAVPQSFSWPDQGYATVQRFCPELAELLDKEFETIKNLTYGSLGDLRGVDTFKVGCQRSGDCL
jgi:hypothetical protein